MSPTTTRYAGAIAATLLFGAVGLANANGTLLVAATLPLVYVGVASLGTPVDPGPVRVTRRIDPSVAGPGDVVRVEVTLENAGDRPLPDIRVVDRVPSDLAVVGGSPRAATALEPGEAHTLEYSLVARRGEHDFEGPLIRSRDAIATRARTEVLEVTGETHLSCRLDAGSPPLSDDAGTGFVGRRRADEPGRGVEFHSTREYRPGDPAHRIAWRHYAKRGDLATVDYERRSAPTVVLAVDSRPICEAAPGPGHPNGLERAAYAASRSLTSLLQEGADVGVAVLGSAGDGPAGLTWQEPDSGPTQRRRGLSTFRKVAEAPRAPAPAEFLNQCRRLTERVGAGTEVVLFTPLLDGRAVGAVATLASTGQPVSVLSPDVVAGNTASGQLESVSRRVRLRRCRALGVPTVDWRRGSPLSLALDAALDAQSVAGASATRPDGTGGGR